MQKPHLRMSQINAPRADRFHNESRNWGIKMSETTTAQRCYLIVMQQVLVAQDLALTISDYDASAIVKIAGTHAEAEAALLNIAQMELAFVADAPSRFMQSSLAQSIRARGGRVILLGEEAEEDGPTQHWGVLNQPFTTDAVLQHLD